MQSMARRLTKSNHTLHDNSGAFMGFDTLLEDSDNSDVEKGDTGKPIDEVSFRKFFFFLKFQFF